MTFGLSAGVYPVETDQSVVVPAVGTAVGGIVIHSAKGPSNAVTLITTNKEFIDTFGKPSTSDLSMYSALHFLERGNRLQVVRVIDTATKAQALVLDTAGTPATTFTVYAANEGAWGNNITIALTDNSTKQANTFYITVNYSGVQVEKFLVSKDSTKLDGFGKSMYLPNVINGVSSYITVTDMTTDALYPDFTKSPYTLAGGADDTAAVTDAEVMAGWDLFAVKEEVEVTFLINGGWDTNAVQAHMISIAETRADCIAILDVPQSATAVADMVTYSTTTLNADTSYAALYAGWPQIYDEYNDVNMYVPPSGKVAAVFAYTQQVAYPWTAPAGLRRGILLDVIGVSNIFSEGDRDSLQEANINPIQSFQGQGIQVYGQKTLTAIPSALDRVNVRMLLITIEKAITAALRPFVFEANDSFTQENISSIINNYMGVVKTQRGVYDYQTVCDSTNNTPQIVDNNELIVDLYVKPTRTAEYIKLNTIVSATGVTFKS
jgi:uncharacterized protein